MHDLTKVFKLNIFNSGLVSLEHFSFDGFAEPKFDSDVRTLYGGFGWESHRRIELSLKQP